MKQSSIFTAIYGFLGMVTIYMAITQYLIGGKTLKDYGIKTTASVVSERIEEREMGTSTSRTRTRYQVSVPTIQYVINGDTIKKEVAHWGSSIDDRVSSSRPLLKPGDPVVIYVHPDETDLFIMEDESDPTNWVGFVIWGGIGAGLMYVFLKRRFSS